MGVGAERDIHRTGVRRDRASARGQGERRPSHTQTGGTPFTAHLRSPFGLIGLTLYAAAAFLLLQRGVGTPVPVLALAATWRWGFLLGATSAIHAALVAAEPVAAGVAAVGSLFAALGTVHAVRSGK